MSDGHHQSHVGIPRVLLSAFEENGSLFAHRMGAQGSLFQTSAEKAGRERDYYDSNAESVLDHLETIIGVVFSYMKKETSIYEFVNYLQENQNFLEDLVKFQMSRSKAALEDVNHYSKYVQLTGIPFTHSDLIKIQNEINANPLQIIQGSLSARLLIATKKQSFITNSLGLFLMATPKRSGGYEFIVPMGPRVAIRLFHAEIDELDYSHFVCGNDEVLTLNKWCVAFELARGNGFLYGSDKLSLMPFLGK